MNHILKSRLLIVLLVSSLVAIATQCANQKKENICTAGDSTSFNQLLTYIGQMHRYNFENLECIAVFNTGMSHDQISTLLQIEKVKVFNIGSTQATRSHQQQMQIKPDITLLKHAIIKQAHDLFISESFEWVDISNITEDNSLLTYIRYKKAEQEKPFVIIIPSYNNEEWCYKNLWWVLSQKYSNYRVIYLNDASKDKTLQNVEKIIFNLDKNKKVQLINNTDRVGALANFYRAIYLCQPNEIVVMLDGDDWLAHENVLQHLNLIYQNENIWMTYGQFKEYPGGHVGGAQSLPQDIINKHTYREYDWVTTHLRTFYASLFHKIDIEDLMYENKFFPMTWDLAIMFPILEMAGNHSQFVPEITYIYNRQTPINDNKVNAQLQITLEQIIRKKAKYLQISNLF